MQTRTRHFLTPLAAAGLLALGACGGGGGSSAPAGPTPLSISGTAATGAALSGAAVRVDCASGNITATTAASGAYDVTLPDATAPCLVRVVSNDMMMTTYYSLVAANTVSSATVNLTPLTTVITTQVLGADPAGAYDDSDEVDPTALALLTPGAVMDARGDLVASLAGRVDLSSIDPIGTAFVVGDSTDQLLDDFNAVLLAAQLTPPELAAALIANEDQPDAVQTVLAPAASSCPSLRSGPIVLVSLGGFSTATVDSAARTTTFDNGAPTTMFNDLGNCEFSTTVSGEFVVSSSSVTISRFPVGGGNFGMSFGFPRQQRQLSELAGTWNYVVYLSENGGPSTPSHGSFTLDSTGRFTGGFLNCTGFNTCETEPVSPTDVLTVVPPEQGGGFVEGGTGNRAFAYRAPNGTTMLFFAINSQDGVSEVGFVVASKQSPLALPVVGEVTPFSQFTITSGGFAGAFVRDVSTVTAVDAGADSFTRTMLNGAPQTLELNSPRNGMRYRAAGSSPDSGGTTVSFPAIVQLLSPGTGVVVSISAAEGSNFFNAGVITPEPAAP